MSSPDFRLKDLTPANLASVTVQNKSADRKYGRRFELVLTDDRGEHHSKELVFRDVFNRIDKLAHKEIADGNVENLEKIQDFLEKLKTVENKAAEEYEARDDALYKFRTWWHRLFTFGSHQKKLQKLSDKIQTILDKPTIPHDSAKAELPRSLKIIGRYDRANDVNDATIVRLMDGKTAYAANKVQITSGPSYIVAESPKGSDAVYVDDNWNEIGREKSEDRKYYYEMVWKEDAPTLVSAAEVYKRGVLDKDTFDFLAEGEEAKFMMSSNDELSVKCISANKEHSWFEIRALELKVGDQTKRTEQWIIRWAFGYDNNGLRVAKILYDNLVKDKNLDPNQVQLIINCNTGKDRSAALIMWIRLFEMLDKQELKTEEITHDYLLKIAEKFEAQTVPGGLKDHIEKTLPIYYPDDGEKIDDAELQEAIKRALEDDVESHRIQLRGQ